MHIPDSYTISRLFDRRISHDLANPLLASGAAEPTRLRLQKHVNAYSAGRSGGDDDSSRIRSDIEIGGAGNREGPVELPVRFGRRRRKQSQRSRGERDAGVSHLTEILRRPGLKVRE